MLEGEGGGEGGAAQRLEELVECKRPQPGDDVVFGGDVAEGGGDAGGKG